MKNCLLPDNPQNSILLAPNAFKDTLKAQEVCRILKEEFQDLPFQVYSFPMCDGGDGSAEIIASYADINRSPFQKIYQLIDYAANLPDAMRHPGYCLREIARIIHKEVLNLI